ncbi:hypothetical protein EMMF5_002882 [Cystobasidiomycetes sp. EMM_F5]
MRHIYKGVRPFGETLAIPPLDCWDGLLGNQDRGIPDDKVLMLDAYTEAKVTYGEARTLATKLAHGLRVGHGMQEGEVVCVFSPNQILFPVACMAIQCASLVAALANSTYTSGELAHLLKDSGSSAIFVGSDHIDTALAAAKEVGIESRRVFALPGIDGTVTLLAHSYERLDIGKRWQHASLPVDKLKTTTACDCSETATTVFTADALVPPIALALSKHPLAAKADFSYLKEFICGAAPMSGDLAKAVERACKVPVHQGYGMTETTAVGAVNRPKGARHDSVGPLLPYIEARIVDDKHNDVNPGDRGEVWLRGPNMITAYHNNKKATDETLTPDGWLRTGDVGYFIDDHLYLVDRTKELIKYKAFQVPPAELEALLLTCELVADAAVIGIYSEEQATELPRAYVTLSEQGKEDENACSNIADFVRERVAPHKRLRGGVFALDVIPKSPSGKILRKDLRAMVAKESKGKAKL